MPKPLNLDNIAANWKKFRKASWDNYILVVRLQRFDEEYKAATFLSAIGKEALLIYKGVTFEPPENESIDHYVSALGRPTKLCNFRQCLHDSLLRDRIVFGVKHPALRKKLPQERQFTLRKAIHICKSGETTAQYLKDLAAATDPNTN